jgi:hypothetical protein
MIGPFKRMRYEEAIEWLAQKAAEGETKALNKEGQVHTFGMDIEEGNLSKETTLMGQPLRDSWSIQSVNRSFSLTSLVLLKPSTCNLIHMILVSPNPLISLFLASGKSSADPCGIHLYNSISYVPVSLIMKLS